MATYPSTLIQAGGGKASPSLMPATTRSVVGQVKLPAGVTLAANDSLPLFYLQSGSGINVVGVFIDSPALDSGATLTMSLQDSSTPPKVLVPTSTKFRAGGTITNADVAGGSMGGSVSYTDKNLIQLLVTAAAGAAIPAGGANINFVVQLAQA